MYKNMTEILKDNSGAHRFEMEIDGHTVFADYRRDGETITLLHVEAPPPLRGKGAAERLMRAIAEQARAGKLKVIPLCSYAAAWLQRSEEYRDLIMQ